MTKNQLYIMLIASFLLVMLSFFIKNPYLAVAIGAPSGVCVIYSFMNLFRTKKPKDYGEENQS
jgi:hypothetical protein